MIKRILKNNTGVTLMEMIVSIAMFSVVMLAAVQIFESVNTGQRSAVAAQNIQDSMRYAFEYMSKEIRYAQLDGTGVGNCNDVANNLVYDGSPSGDRLDFKNIDEECVTYYLDVDRLMIDRDGVAAALTPDELKISNLNFDIVSDPSVQQPRVTISMDAEAIGKNEHKQTMKMQTSVSTRYYE